MILLTLSAASAATLTVAPDGSADHTTIQGAIESAASGDTIVIAAGSYEECVDTSGKDLVLEGAGADEVVVDGAGTCEAALTVGSGEVVDASGLSLTNEGGTAVYVEGTLGLSAATIRDSGASGLGGGGIAVHGGIATLDSVELIDNQASTGGHAWIGLVATLELIDCTLSGGSATQGGAVYVDNYGTLLLEDSEVVGNSATNGGGLYATNPLDLEVSGSSLRDNTATYDGGGVYLYSGSGTLIFADTELSGNTAGRHGGGLHSYYVYAEVLIGGSRLQDNVAADYGGGIYLFGAGDLVVQDSDFEGNSAGVSGGALNFSPYSASWDLVVADSRFSGNDAGYGAALFSTLAGTITVSGITASSNVASGWGGGLFVDDAYALEVRRSLWCANEAQSGGAAFLDGLSTTGSWANNAFLDNSASSSGGAIAALSGSALSLTNNDLLGNSAPTGGAIHASSSALSLANNLVAWTGTGAALSLADSTSASGTVRYGAWFDNEGGDTSGEASLVIGEDGNIDGDPLLAWMTGDCELGPLIPGEGSPLIDAGDPELLDVDGSPSDIGITGGLEAPELDVDGDGVLLDEDCDDEDPSIYPGAEDLPDDGIDQDCDGEDATAGDGGSSDGGADGGTSDGGASDGGTSDGGASDGGADGGTDGGTTDGGTADGGTDGGATDGGGDGSPTTGDGEVDKGCAVAASPGALGVLLVLAALGRRRDARRCA